MLKNFCLAYYSAASDFGFGMQEFSRLCHLTRFFICVKGSSLSCSCSVFSDNSGVTPLWGCRVSSRESKSKVPFARIIFFVHEMHGWNGKRPRDDANAHICKVQPGSCRCGWAGLT